MKSRRTSRAWWGPALLFFGMTSLGCVRIGTFFCELDSQCQLNGVFGQCFAPGFCGFADPTCESEFRFHDPSAGEGLAGECVPLSESTNSSGASEDSEVAGADTISIDSTTSGGPTDSDSTEVPPCEVCPSACETTHAVSTGDNHNCVARTDGRVVCWGDNRWERLGREAGTTGSNSGWAKESAIPKELSVTDVFSGPTVSCARALNDDPLWCWGDNRQGMIVPGGDNTVEPTPLSVAENPTAVGIANAHLCVSNGMVSEVLCQGNGSFDRLGGGIDAAPGPEPVTTVLPGSGPIDDIALGIEHTCVRRGPQVWCWGRNNHGQLGTPSVAGSTSVPTEVALPADAIQLISGRFHSCVLLDNDLGVMCWGRNDRGQLGVGNDEPGNGQPTPLAMDELPAPVVKLYGGTITSCAQLANSELWCWGGKVSGWIIDPMSLNAVTTVAPQRVTIVDELQGAIRGFSLGHDHMCALLESSELWCWGNEESKVLSTGDLPDLQSVVEIDVTCNNDGP